MVAFLIATLISSVSFANSPASIPSTKIVAESVSEKDSILQSIDHDQIFQVKQWLKQGHSSFSIVQNKMRESILDRAASLGSEKVFELLLTDMESKNISNQHSWRDGRGTPILLGLISLATPSNRNVHKYERMIERFLSKHSDQIDFQDKAYIGDGRTALHQAAANGNLVVLKALLSHGAHINSLNSTGETPLHFAARFGQLAVLKTLIRNGAKLNEKSKFTLVTPLLAAAENGHEVIIRELLDAGAKKDAKDIFGKSAPERYRDYVSNYYHHISNKN
jgi:ankyrin repeat protein